MQDLKVHYLKLIDNAAVFGFCHNSLYIVMTLFIKPPLSFTYAPYSTRSKGSLPFHLYKTAAELSRRLSFSLALCEM